jgi:hypothetical protein
VFGNRTGVEVRKKLFKIRPNIHKNFFFDDNIDNVPLAINIPASGKGLFSLSAAGI